MSEHERNIQAVAERTGLLPSVVRVCLDAAKDLRRDEQVIPGPAVEAAAKALRRKFNGYAVERPWDSRDQRRTYRNDAIAALEAAAPHMTNTFPKEDA